MRRRRPNPRHVKIHRSYTVEEAACLLGAHKNTIRHWLKSGLPAIDDRRPTLVHGRDLRAFLELRRRKAKRPCPPGHLYCLRCRSPKRPAGRMTDYLPMTPISGNLRAICPECEALMHRRIGIAQLDVVQADLDIAFPHGDPRIRESARSCVDCDSGSEKVSYENAQP